jgi:hypothetical protein
MSNYPPPGVQGSPYAQPGYPPPQRSGCGCGGCLGKILILLGIIFLLIILACGGIIFYASKHMTQQPGDVRTITDEITSMRVPTPLEPVGGGSVNLSAIGLVGEGAVYVDKDHKNSLVVISCRDFFGVSIKDQFVKMLESGQIKQTNNGPDEREEELKDVKKTPKELTIRGQKAVFEITEGVGVKSGKKKIRVQGAFEGKLGAAMLMMDVEEATISREQVDEVIQSIADGAEEKK